jgi:hypothetical protein
MIAGQFKNATVHRQSNVRAARPSSSGRRLQTRVQASSEPTITVKVVEDGQQPVVIECISGEEQLRAAMLDNKGGQQLQAAACRHIKQRCTWYAVWRNPAQQHKNNRIIHLPPSFDK